MCNIVFILTKEKTCYGEHKQPCKAFIGLLSFAKRILHEGFIQLNEAFAMSTPGIKYKARDAKRKLLQIPPAALRVNESMLDVIYLVSKETNLDLTRSLLKKKGFWFTEHWCTVVCKLSEGIALSFRV